jgi:transposase-like protein
MTETPMLAVCPECETTDIRHRVSKGRSRDAIGDERYRCVECEARFDDPKERPSKRSDDRASRRGLSAKLEAIGRENDE